MQRESFEHGREAMLRSDVIHALLQRDASGARNALLLLLSKNPDDNLVPALSVLVGALERPFAARLADPDALRHTYREMCHDICPTARLVFGDTESNAWLTLLWREFAEAAEPLPMGRADATILAAQLWINAQAWEAAQDAVRRVESWWSIPLTLGWMTEAQYHQHGLDAIWPMLAQLAWLSPTRLDVLMRRLADTSLIALRQAFDAGFDGVGGIDDLAWFPAWALIENPTLASFFATVPLSTQASPERTMRLILTLLNLERSGSHHELMERRKALQAANPAMFSAYMRTRTTNLVG